MYNIPYHTLYHIIPTITPTTSPSEYIIVITTTGLWGWYSINTDRTAVLMTPSIAGASVASGYTLKSTQGTYPNSKTANERLQIASNEFSHLTGQISLASFDDIRAAAAVIPIATLAALMPCGEIAQDGTGLTSNPIFFVTYNGNIQWGSTGRFYQVTVIQGNTVPGWYLAHDVIYGSGDFIITLGSWYHDVAILAKLTLTSTQIQSIILSTSVYPSNKPTVAPTNTPTTSPSKIPAAASGVVKWLFTRIAAPTPIFCCTFILYLYHFTRL